MNYSRIRGSVDVSRLAKSRVALVGTGGGRDMACDIVRSGVREIRLFGLDHVEEVNLSRQGFLLADVGRTKVDATAKALRAINPDVIVRTSTDDITKLPQHILAKRFADVDLLILATDRFLAQAKGNEIALALGIPAMWIGLYLHGLGGEIAFWHPGIAACFRCVCANRYADHARLVSGRDSLDPPSDGATILDIHLVDAIAGQIAIGLLTRGSATRYGQLIDALGDRNFIQVKIDPEFRIGSRDIVRELLGVPAENDCFFSWNAVARRDPDRGQLYCEDCARLRGHQFVQENGQWRRVVSPPQPLAVEAT